MNRPPTAIEEHRAACMAQVKVIVISLAAAVALSYGAATPIPMALWPLVFPYAWLQVRLADAAYEEAENRRVERALKRQRAELIARTAAKARERVARKPLPRPDPMALAPLTRAEAAKKGAKFS
jgi:hypothetical protein